VEGFLYLIIIGEIILGLIGALLLAGTYALLQRTRHPGLRFAILLLGMGANFALFMNGDASLLLAGALLLGLPMAVLLPPFLFPSLAGGAASLRRILLCYAILWVPGVAFPFLLVISGLSMVPAIFWHTPLSNAVIYAFLMVVDIALAAIVYRIAGALTAAREKTPG